MFSNPPLATVFWFGGFFWFIFLFNIILASLQWAWCVFYKQKLTLSQTLTHPSPQKPGPTIPLGGIIYSSKYFWFALFTAFWCTHCTGTLKKQATEHKVKWRFICWKINIKKLTISHLSQVSCIGLVLPTYSTTHIHDGHHWAPTSES